jgi:hypothetical protein
MKTEQQFKHITVKPETYQKLKTFGAFGESYDQVVSRILLEYEKRKNDENNNNNKGKLVISQK